jgi:hypothetical protein
VIHLAAGQKLAGIRLQLPARMQMRTVHVQVKWPDDRTVGPGASVTTDESEDGVTDFEETKEDGSASVRCFAANRCTVEASMWLTKLSENATPQRAMSLPRQIEAGDAPVSITLTLTETKSGWGQRLNADTAHP